MAAANINHALKNTLTIARNEYKYVADIETDFGELPEVHCHINELNQVFLNILVNAAHAIEDAVSGTDQRGLIRVSTAMDGDKVLITFVDSGTGIPEAIRAKIFDAFFTTKAMGKGTGQGLAIARNVVVNKHKGTLTCESEIGVGTTFTIRVPIGHPLESSGEVAA
jgi:signal transduction histidine kinase